MEARYGEDAEAMLSQPATKVFLRTTDLLFHGIHCIVAEIQSCGLSPTVSRVVERIPEGSRSNWKFITSATRQARKVLCISK